MGIFSFIGKKGQPETPETDKEQLRRKQTASRVGTPRPDRDAALATARKIDAIESEMTSELSRTPKKTGPAPAAAATSSATAAKTLPPMNMSSDFLLGADAAIASVEISSSETPAIIEEAAILFANEQNEVVEQMLLGAVNDTTLGDALRTVWLMLFDLYHINGRKEQFEQLSIDFAAKFETSPPPWIGTTANAPAAPQTTSGAPALTFSGKLDESIVKQLDRAQKMGEKSGVLRLEFARVSEVLPEGCELLLATLKKLQKARYEFIMVGAPELAVKIRAIIEVGRRDDNQAPWLLLMEILQMLNRESEFEEASIDYCVTYEVSPPAFVPLKNKVSTAVEELVKPDDAAGKFMMPSVIDARSNVLANIAEFANTHDPVLLDCSQLMRVDFSAAGQLLSGLAPLAGKGKTVELKNVNHLVAALFQVMGLREVAQVHTHKH